MEFRTKVDIPRNLPQISHAHHLLLLGSCFAEHIGRMLVETKFRCDVNPFGILYNPSSVCKALKEMMEGKQYTEKDLFLHDERYCSYMHHGSFAHRDVNESLASINSRLQQAHRSIPNLNYLLITFGTAWVYTLKEDGRVVSNCHKVPARCFERKRLSVEEIVSEYSGLLRHLSEAAPGCKVIFTVSPIRHAKDGLHENQLSKATLLLAVDALQAKFPAHVCYFPSYEIVLDELRDYRFFADDMNHPSGRTVEYIWERFAEGFFGSETQKILKEYESIRKDLLHRPLRKDSEAYKRFLEQIVLKINRLTEKYPNLDVENEILQCRTLLK